MAEPTINAPQWSFDLPENYTPNFPTMPGETTGTQLRLIRGMFCMSQRDFAELLNLKSGDIYTLEVDQRENPVPTNIHNAIRYLAEQHAHWVSTIDGTTVNIQWIGYRKLSETIWAPERWWHSVIGVALTQGKTFTIDTTNY